MSIEVAAVLSLVFLVVAIALGFAKGMNTGVVSMAFALIACIVCGLTDKQLRSGFPTNMFLILFGTMFLSTLRRKQEPCLFSHVRSLPQSAMHLSFFLGQFMR